MVQVVFDKGQDLLIVYLKILDVNVQLQFYIIVCFDECFSYFGLVKINWDYFGVDVCIVYNVCYFIVL